MSSATNYNAIDKTLHYLAFLFPSIQRALSELENDLYKKELSHLVTSKQVFVTGLPRSGTTLLLELLYKSDQFSTFSYRHMPFILAPLLWKKISKPFSKKATNVERAHGDGMQVSFDSPEAFEEVIWLSYLKDKYVKTDRLEQLTTQNTTKKFARNFQTIINKLLIESSDKQNIRRYLSKNNANCSRLPLLMKLFPEATILVPFREPLAHIGSLMKQHQQFSDMHKDDKFSKRYMRWLGHYDFGDNFKPINFNQWLEKSSDKPDYSKENFWLEYWIEAYSKILSDVTHNIHLVDFDKLLNHPQQSLQSIATHAEIVEQDKFSQFAETIRKPTSKARNEANLDPELLRKAKALYQELQKLAI